MKQWTLDRSSFDKFLTDLDPNRDRAGQKYEALRTRIVKFFEWRACRFPDDLADETLDRVVKKIDSGVEINDFVKLHIWGRQACVFGALQNTDQGTSHGQRTARRADRR